MKSYIVIGFPLRKAVIPRMFISKHLDNICAGKKKDDLPLHQFSNIAQEADTHQATAFQNRVNGASSSLQALKYPHESQR